MNSNYGPTYPKIHSIFKREMRGNRDLLIGQYAQPEFEYLAKCGWRATEKVDGMNVRVHVENGVVAFGGRTDNAQMPDELYSRLYEIFTAEKIATAFSDGKPITLYGEGYGKKIQSGGAYLPHQDFILFDVRVGDWWLEFESVQEVGAQLGVKVVPELFANLTLEDAVQACKAGFPSALKPGEPEGIVLTTRCGLKNRSGQRVITKAVLADYKKGVK